MTRIAISIVYLFALLFMVRQVDLLIGVEIPTNYAYVVHNALRILGGVVLGMFMCHFNKGA